MQIINWVNFSLKAQQIWQLKRRTKSAILKASVTFFSNSAFHYKAPPTHHSIMGIKDITVNGPWTAYLLRLE